MALHSNYWSCSKFADIIRGTPKLSSGTSEEWEDWDYKASQAHPIRFWVAEELLDKLQDFFTFPKRMIRNVGYYLNNRFVSHSNALVANKKDVVPGEWCDLSSRILPCMFNALVDFVEIEKAWLLVCWSDENRKKYHKPWWYKFWLTRTFNWRSKEAGLAYLEWEMSLNNNEFLSEGDPGYNQPSRQAIAAAEVIALYTWWTAIYPNRKDPYTENLTYDEMNTLEAEYEKENEEMMIRLIKVRHSLWS